MWKDTFRFHSDSTALYSTTQLQSSSYLLLCEFWTPLFSPYPRPESYTSIAATLVTCSQSPADVDQRRRSSYMRSSPRQSHTAEISRVMHHQLGNNVETQQINYLGISRCENLRQRSSKRETCNHNPVSNLIQQLSHRRMPETARSLNVPGKFSISA